VTRTPQIVLRSLLPSPLRISGLALLPVTIGHCLVLDRLGSAALTGEPMKQVDLFRCLYVLGYDYQFAAARLDLGLDVFDAAVVEYSKTIPVIEETEIQLILRAHLQGAGQSNADVEFKQEEGAVQFGPDGNGCGWILNLVSALLALTHQPMERILDTPVITAMALSVVDRVRAGAEWHETSWTACERQDGEGAEEELAKRVDPKSDGHVGHEARRVPGDQKNLKTRRRPRSRQKES
jgi:hypothetical protein